MKVITLKLELLEHISTTTASFGNQQGRETVEYEDNKFGSSVQRASQRLTISISTIHQRNTTATSTTRTTSLSL